MHSIRQRVLIPGTGMPLRCESVYSSHTSLSASSSAIGLAVATAVEVATGLGVVAYVRESMGSTVASTSTDEDTAAAGVVDDEAISCAAEVATCLTTEVATCLTLDEATPAAGAGALPSSALTQPVFFEMAAGQDTCLNDTLGLSAPMNQSNRQ